MQKIKSKVLIAVNLIFTLFISNFLLLTFNFSLISSVSAHTLTTDGSIGAVLHIDPEDDPIAGQPAFFFFEIKDRDGKFDPKNCQCIVTIQKDNATILTQDLFANISNPNLDNASFSFTFPEKNIYKVTLTGNPKTVGDFQEFKISSDIRIERYSSTPVNDNQNQPLPQNWFIKHNLHFVAAGIIIVIFIFMLFKQNKRNV